MKIALYGATGTVGQRILTEALSRGHDVTAIVRDPLRLAVSDAKLTVKTGDALDSASVATIVVGARRRDRGRSREGGMATHS